MKSFEEVLSEYREGMKRDNAIRDRAYHDFGESICGFELRPMSFLDFLALRLIRSPFISGGNPTLGDVRAFLWRMSPHYTPGKSFKRILFMRKCRCFLPPLEPRLFLPRRGLRRQRRLERWARKALARCETLGNVLKGIREYVAESLQDWGSEKVAANGEPVHYFSDAAETVGMIARDYKWSEAEIVNLPMSRLLQYRKEIMRANGQKVLFNPSDRMLFEWAKERNKPNAN